MIAGPIPDYWKLPIWFRSLTLILTPTYPNIILLRPTHLDEDPPEIPVWQGIIRHQPTPGQLLAGLEQNPAYRTAQAPRPIDKGLSRIGG